MLRSILFSCAVFFSAHHVLAQEEAPKREISKGMVITGLCLFLTPEAICIAVAALDKDASALPIPLVGPFITNANETPNSTEGLTVALCLSAAEAAGIALFTVGLIGKKSRTREIIAYPIIRQNGYGLKLKVNL
jgi:hypothetical protein